MEEGFKEDFKSRGACLILWSLTQKQKELSFFLLSIYWQHYDKLNVLDLDWVFLYFNMFHQTLHYRIALNIYDESIRLSDPKVI